MKVSDNGLNFIKNEEGSMKKAYKDQGGLWTIGVGHLIRADEKHLLTDTLTDDQILALLRNDIGVTENAINNWVKQPLTQNQFDALASLIFNIGDGAFHISTLLKKVNVNPNDQKFVKTADITDPAYLWMKNQLLAKNRTVLNTIEYSFLVWHMVAHKPNADLYGRRNREYKLYSTK